MPPYLQLAVLIYKSTSLTHSARQRIDTAYHISKVIFPKPKLVCLCSLKRGIRILRALALRLGESFKKCDCSWDWLCRRKGRDKGEGERERERESEKDREIEKEREKQRAKARARDQERERESSLSHSLFLSRRARHRASERQL